MLPAFLVLQACGGEPNAGTPGDESGCTGSNGYGTLSTDSYGIRAYLPDNYSPEQKYPTVVSLAGWTNDADKHNGFLNLDEYAAEKGYILLLPSNSSTVTFGWNLNSPVEGYEGLLEDLKGQRGNTSCPGRSFDGRSMDLNRVVVAGHSAGARAAYMIAAAETSHPPVGVVAFAGDGAGSDLTGGSTEHDRAAAPTFLIHIHGTGDGVVNYSGGERTFEAYYKDVNSCSGRADSSVTRSTTVTEGNGCSRPTSFFSIRGGAHEMDLDRQGVMGPVVDKMLSNLR